MNCPICGQFTFSVNRGRFSCGCCMVCGNGNAIDFYARMKGLTPLEAQATLHTQLQNRSLARQLLGEIMGEASRFYQHCLWETMEGQPGRNFLERQGIGRQTAQHFSLGYAASQRTQEELAAHLRSKGFPKNSLDFAYLHFYGQDIVMPYRDASGTCWGFFAQLIGPDGTDLGVTTYVFGKMNELTPFRHERSVCPPSAWPRALGRYESVLVVRRPWDVIVLSQADIPNAVHPCSGGYSTGRALVDCKKGQDRAYRTMSALASQIIMPIEERDTLPTTLRLISLSAYQPVLFERFALLFLPSDRTIADILHQEGAEAFRQRMQQAIPIREQLGIT